MPPKRHFKKKKPESPSAAKPPKRVKHSTFLMEAMSKKTKDSFKEANASKKAEVTEVTSAFKAPDVPLTSQVAKATSASRAPDLLVNTSPEEEEVVGQRQTRSQSKEIARS
ncbi:hypothetical protein SARC_02120 [Sphaeroforma arctica JP610]|uniref:Uncharacterized protein n=1 Tax=Sphaeroforma arctica JP610 TaxID=667725 RepID=A0A0L0G9N2_9EUKA|nr:hypothetical protein SARC_02120 [Sphaeroforma arctica JP610]KNC85710.1 hypothetical protein SARC_02120 [Sphaeroforma arctica JP610]|eukprot:XP_014159612.1 hypothetical protein SARC_02120 [Sphaeroforma arctica JP610]